MGVSDLLREWLEELKERLKKAEEEPSWEEPVAEEKPASTPIGERLSRVFSWRWRVFSALAKVNVVLNIALVILLYSNTWYLNVLLFLFLAPNTVMLLHYLRLLGKAKAESG
jgi:hypothetical protein